MFQVDKSPCHCTVDIFFRGPIQIYQSLAGHVNKKSRDILNEIFMFFIMYFKSILCITIHKFINRFNGMDVYALIEHILLCLLFTSAKSFSRYHRI